VVSTTIRILKRLWRDRSGTTSPAALILLTTIVILGAIVGLVTVRDYIVQEFGDVAVALDRIDQSYSYDLGRDLNADMDFTDPGEFQLICSFTDTSILTDPLDAAPACLDLTIAPAGESP
jgi:hypothetical protein